MIYLKESLGGGDRSGRGGDRSGRGGDRSGRGGDRSERGGDRSGCSDKDESADRSERDDQVAVGEPGGGIYRARLLLPEHGVHGGNMYFQIGLSIYCIIISVYILRFQLNDLIVDHNTTITNSLTRDNPVEIRPLLLSARSLTYETSQDLSHVRIDENQPTQDFKQIHSVDLTKNVITPSDKSKYDLTSSSPSRPPVHDTSQNSSIDPKASDAKTIQ
ncbi:unnamed protein product [Rotaria socialis]|uniref:Uncharacterized protein n=1 Tax=Rotaria socialis TaxID=392032 RepID=A0A821DVA5_9BILA|nr:unnamed protein product [Rotaria socialis]